MGVTVTGAREWLTALRDLSDGLADLPHAQAARALADKARARAPRRTGRLASSVATSSTRTAAEVSVGVGYALPVHSGTKHMNANPFLWHDEAARDAEGIYADHLTNLTD